MFSYSVLSRGHCMCERAITISSNPRKLHKSTNLQKPRFEINCCVLCRCRWDVGEPSDSCDPAWHWPSGSGAAGAVRLHCRNCSRRGKCAGTSPLVSFEVHYVYITLTSTLCEVILSALWGTTRMGRSDGLCKLTICIFANKGLLILVLFQKSKCIHYQSKGFEQQDF